MPATRAAFGTRLFAVMPGIVFTSSATRRSVSGDQMRSRREIALQPSAR